MHTQTHTHPHPHTPISTSPLHGHTQVGLCVGYLQHCCSYPTFMWHGGSESFQLWEALLWWHCLLGCWCTPMSTCFQAHAAKHAELHAHMHTDAHAHVGMHVCLCIHALRCMHACVFLCVFLYASVLCVLLCYLSTGATMSKKLKNAIHVKPGCKTSSTGGTTWEVKLKVLKATDQNSATKCMC